MKEIIKEDEIRENAEIRKNIYQKSAELKKKSAELNERLDATFRECDKMLHPEKYNGY